MHVYEYFKKYIWNIYAFITYKSLKMFILQYINSQLKK